MKVRSWIAKGFLLVAIAGIIALGAALLSEAAQGKKEPAAMITNLSGEVFLWREGVPTRVRAELASFLFAGDKLDLGGNGAATLVYFRGCRQDILKGKGTVIIIADKTKDLGKTMVSSAPLTKCGPPPKVEITSETSLAKGVLTLRGQAMITRLSPSETKVLTVKPAFSWLSPDPKKFTVALYDKNLVKLWQVEAPGQEITYPPQAPPLRRGEMYRWSVNNDVHAYFAVATEEEVKALEEKRKAYELAAAQASPDPTYLLLSALLYSEAGFNLEAADYYQKVLQLAPKSRQVRLKLAEIYDQMGWSAEAKKELEEAKRLETGE